MLFPLQPEPSLILGCARSDKNGTKILKTKTITIFPEYFRGSVMPIPCTQKACGTIAMNTVLLRTISFAVKYVLRWPVLIFMGLPYVRVEVKQGRGPKRMSWVEGLHHELNEELDMIRHFGGQKLISIRSVYLLRISYSSLWALGIAPICWTHYRKRHFTSRLTISGFRGSHQNSAFWPGSFQETRVQSKGAIKWGSCGLGLEKCASTAVVWKDWRECRRKCGPDAYCH